MASAAIERTISDRLMRARLEQLEAELREMRDQQHEASHVGWSGVRTAARLRIAPHDAVLRAPAAPAKPAPRPLEHPQPLVSLQSQRFADGRLEPPEQQVTHNWRSRKEQLNFAKKIAPTIVYLFVGVVAYLHLEGWPALDSIYFCCVTMTTVGYGDLGPTTALSTVFTAVMILVGIAFVFAPLLDAMEFVMAPAAALTAALDRLVDRFFPPPMFDIEGDGDADFVRRLLACTPPASRAPLLSRASRAASSLPHRSTRGRSSSTASRASGRRASSTC